MTFRTGMNVDPLNPAGCPSPQALIALGIDSIRLVLRDVPDVYSYIWDSEAAGLSVLSVLTSQSFTSMKTGDMIKQARRYAAALPGRSWQLGNEPDGLAPASWQMTQAGYASLVNSLAPVFKASGAVDIVAAGMCSGDPTWLSPIWPLPVTAIAVHPYAKVPADAINLVASYAGEYNKPAWITEWNRPSVELCQLRTLAISCGYPAFWFAWSEGMVPGFGLVDGPDKLAAWRACVLI